MKILVTGGAGFIGSHVCERLIAAHEIHCIDNFCDYYDPAIKWDNISELRKQDGFELHQGDIRDNAFLRSVFAGTDFDAVIHLSAMAGVRGSISDPHYYVEVDVNGTLNLLDFCRERGIRHFILASSSSVYGNNSKVPFAESDRVDHPISPYAAAKKACELIAHTYWHLYGISMLILRFFTVYGPRQRPDLAIHKFTRMIYEGEPLTLFGDGSTRRDYTYIDDIVDGVELALDYVVKNRCYDIFNLGESRTVSLLEMVETLERVTGITAQKKWMPKQPGDVEQTYADISKSVRLLGYNPQTSFESGIQRFVDWYRVRFVR